MGKKAKKAKKAAKAAGAQPIAASGSDKKLRNTVRRYTQHVLVCTDSKSKQCRKGGPDVLKAFQKALKARNLSRYVMVSEIGHVGGCSLGPNVIIYPDGVWYGRVEPADVDEIIDEHLVEGHVVQRLLRGQRADDPCGGCSLAPPILAARHVGEVLT